MSLKKGTTTISGLGSEGFSPSASVSKSGITTTITITDKNGTTTSQIVDENIQYSTMPTAGADTVGKLVQYTGTTDSNYTNGYFYKGTSTTEGNETTYSWEQVDVQDNITLDSTPTENSTNGVTSGGVYTALQSAGGGLDLVTYYSFQSSFNIYNAKVGIYNFKNQDGGINFYYDKTRPDVSFLKTYTNKIMDLVVTKEIDWTKTASETEIYAYLTLYDGTYISKVYFYRSSGNLTGKYSTGTFTNALLSPNSNASIGGSWNFGSIPTINNWLTVNYANQLVPRSFVDNYIGTNYNSNNTYAVGDLVLHDTNLYQCNTAIETPEAWNSSKWTKTTLASAIKGMSS